MPRNPTSEEWARAELLFEWIVFFHQAIRFGADNIRAGQIADALVGIPLDVPIVISSTKEIH